MARRNGSEPKNLTVEILRQIRDEVRKSNDRLDRVCAEQRAMHEEQRAMREEQVQTNMRLGTVETTVRDLAEQMMVLGRAVKVAIEHRKGVDRQPP